MFNIYSSPASANAQTLEMLSDERDFILKKTDTLLIWERIPSVYWIFSHFIELHPLFKVKMKNGIEQRGFVHHIVLDAM